MDGRGLRQVEGRAPGAERLLPTRPALKPRWEVLPTPVTCPPVGWLRRRRDIAAYDGRTDFNPLGASA